MGNCNKSGTGSKPKGLSVNTSTAPRQIKLLTIGDSDVGKTSLLLRYTEGSFQEQAFSSINMDFKSKNVELGDKNYLVQVWDTAGQERYKTITSPYYRDSDGILICFSLSDEESFKNISAWLKDIERYAPEGVVRLLIGTKSDLGDRKISEVQATKLANDYDLKFVETSAKTGAGVDKAFLECLREVLKQI
eukprot:TRINITY_DN3614_c0_g1_i1.p1 TRINITY_DN3614_c0_g1~~TRINITY_DN3614_c0_g1_i1.p1  ORF type:complete len:191 (-),score=33.79 TRINITY_DN3614_c0_g1_i1:24-596(-)